MGGKFKWPQLDDVIEYRRKVRHLILQLIDRTPLELPVTMDSPWVSWTFLSVWSVEIQGHCNFVLLQQFISSVSQPLFLPFGF